MVMTVVSPAAPAPIPQGHCSRCGRVWTQKERQGVCQWCGKPATCQSSTSKPRHIKSRSYSSRKQPHPGNSYDRLTGQWLTYYKVASKFAHKAKAEDTEDLLHDIILTLALAERNNGHQPFTEAVMYRIASHTVADYWFKYYKLTTGLDCGHCSQSQRHKCKEEWLYSGCPKVVKIESLNKPVIDSEGYTTEVGELIADDKALDLEAWTDARTFLIGFPQRLLAIADKLNNGQALVIADRKYLCKWRKREQKALIAG